MIARWTTHFDMPHTIYKGRRFRVWYTRTISPAFSGDKQFVNHVYSLQALNTVKGWITLAEKQHYRVSDPIANEVGVKTVLDELVDYAENFVFDEADLDG